MNKQNFITCSRRIFLVRFSRSTERYIVQDKELFALIKANEGEPIEMIKVSETYDPKFKRCSKALILRQFSWDTEIIEYFKKLPYFKGVKF